MQHSAGSPACTAAPNWSEDISFAKFDTSGIPRAGKNLKQAPKAERRAFGRLSRDVQNEDGHLGRGLGILLQLRGNPIEELAEHVRPIQTQALVKGVPPAGVVDGVDKGARKATEGLVHRDGLSATIAAGDHGGMLLPGADPVADILDDLAPGTTRQRLRAPTTSLSRRPRRLYPNNISSRAKTTEASTAALRATTCSLAFAGSCGRIIRFTASCRRPSGDSRKARSESSFARSESSFARSESRMVHSNAAEDTTTPDPCRTSVDLGFQSAPTLRHRCQLSAEPVGAGLRYQARVQSRSSALRQRAFSLAGRSANSSWASSVNGAKQLHSYSFGRL